MRCLVAILLTFALSAASYAQTSIYVGFLHRANRAQQGTLLVPRVAPMYVQPVQPAPVTPPVPYAIQVPATVNVQVVVPQTTYRWGFFRRRLVPQTTNTLGPQLRYKLQEGQ